MFKEERASYYLTNTECYPFTQRAAIKTVARLCYGATGGNGLIQVPIKYRIECHDEYS